MRLNRRIAITVLAAVVVTAITTVIVASGANPTSAVLAGLGLGVTIGWLVGMALVGRVSWAVGEAETQLEQGRLHVRPTGVTDLDRLLIAMHAVVQTSDVRLADLESDRSKIRTVIDGMGEGVVAADEDGRMLLANRSARVFLGIRPGNGQPSLDELFVETPAAEIIDAVRHGEIVAGREVELRGRSVLMTARPLPHGGMVVALVDLSDARRIEAVRRDFVANVSHELKTPLTSILGYAETLLEADTDPAVRRQFTSVIHNNASRMQKIVEDLLNLARVESGAWTPLLEDIDLASAVREAEGAIADRRVEGGLAITVSDQNVRVKADRMALQTILVNLLENAQRHTPADGTVRVDAKENGTRVMVSITDTGSGIAAEHLPRLFERFYRVDPGRSRAEGGTGLGLSIVRHLVEVHGGSVTVDSTVGEGTTVQFSIPKV